MLQELPEQWNTLKKLSVSMKQTVAPLQANEVNILRRKLASFDVKQHEFRENFRKKAPFAYNSDFMYARIDRVSFNTTLFMCLLVTLVDKSTDSRNGKRNEVLTRGSWPI